MDILGKAANIVGEAAGQAVTAAALQRQINAERRALAELRGQALALRAQIGEEMFKLWQMRNLPPSSLDHLFVAIERTMGEMARQRAVVERLLAQRAAGGQAALTEAEDETEVIDITPLPPPPLPAAPTRRLGAGPPGGVCPTCGAGDVGNRPYCGYCGSRLS